MEDWKCKFIDPCCVPDTVPILCYILSHLIFMITLGSKYCILHLIKEEVHSEILIDMDKGMFKSWQNQSLNPVPCGSETHTSYVAF